MWPASASVTPGLADVADHDPFSLAELAEYRSAGRAWVAVDDGDSPVGYVVADVVDGAGHVEQISVRPDHQGQGVGQALLAQVARWARAEGFVSLTLTTFDTVPWNRPLYDTLASGCWATKNGPSWARWQDHEIASGLDPAQRVCMRLELEAGSRDRVGTNPDGGVDSEVRRSSPVRPSTRGGTREVHVVDPSGHHAHAAGPGRLGPSLPT